MWFLICFNCKYSFQAKVVLVPVFYVKFLLHWASNNVDESKMVLVIKFYVRLVCKSWKDKMSSTFNDEEKLLTLLSLYKEKIILFIPLRNHQRTNPRNKIQWSIPKELKIAIPEFKSISWKLNLELLWKRLNKAIQSIRISFEFKIYISMNIHPQIMWHWSLFIEI